MIKNGLENKNDTINEKKKDNNNLKINKSNLIYKNDDVVSFSSITIWRDNNNKKKKKTIDT